jgi:squalene synthase HpnD
MTPDARQSPTEQAADLDHVHSIVTCSGSSFISGMRVLPRARREAMYAIYAFCREVDDIADRTGDLNGRVDGLDKWRDEIVGLYAGRPTHPITRALQRPIESYALPQSEFHAIVDGMEMDLRGAMRAPSMTELQTYCRRVAGAVGVLSMSVFGAPKQEAEEIALILGEALQLTNILRDLLEDAELNRLYLPYEMLDAHGIQSRDPSEVLAHPSLSRVCADLAGHARDRFQQTHILLELCDRRRLKSCVLMMAVYERILTKLERQNWQNLAEPVRVSRVEKLWIFARHGLI